MAKIIGGIGGSLRGSIHDLSFYKMKGVEEVIVRRKGGPSKKKIRTDPNLEMVRRYNAEFGGRAKAAKWIMRALSFQKPLADHNVAGPLNSLLTLAQNLDTVGELGERNVRLSASPLILKGFSLNRNNPFDSTVRFPVAYELSRETAAATVRVPELIPGINLFTPGKYPLFCLQVTLGIVPDIVFSKGGYELVNPDYEYFEHGQPQAVSDWYPVVKGSPATTLEVKYTRFPLDGNFTLVLAIGVKYGILQDTQTILQAKHAGCAKVLEVA
jgi:hypothetical protein